MNEKMRKSRIKSWVIWIIIASLFLVADQYKDAIFNGMNSLWENINKEKVPFVVCAPEDMQGAFENALKIADMDSDYELVMTSDNTNANVWVDYAKENDEFFLKFAFSPFVVAYSNDSGYSKKLIKNGLISVDRYDDNYCEINLFKLIEVILDDEEWDNYGINGFEKVTVAHPSTNSIYWNDFYNLMLVSANHGKYPKDQDEYNAAAKILDEFFESENTKALDNFDDIKRKGFTADIFYIGPEKVFLQISKNEHQNGRLIYLTKTVYFNWYLNTDELGSKIISTLDKINGWGDSFYRSLANKGYRNNFYHTLEYYTDYIYDERNTFDIIDIPKNIMWKMEAEN